MFYCICLTTRNENLRDRLHERPIFQGLCVSILQRRLWHHSQRLGDLLRVAGGVGSDATTEAVDGRANIYIPLPPTGKRMESGAEKTQKALDIGLRSKTSNRDNKHAILLTPVYHFPHSRQHHPECRSLHFRRRGKRVNRIYKILAVCKCFWRFHNPDNPVNPVQKKFCNCRK